jgi:outer membrane protein assembly factor BamD
MNQFLTLSFKTAGGLFLMLLMLASCSNKELIQRGDTPDVAYEKAYNLYEKEEYRKAAEAFETVIQMGRGTDFARDAQYYLAESYYKDERYLLAAAEYERHATLYPRSELRQEVDFKEALSYYNLSPRYKLDQQYTHSAIDRFRLFNSRYPNSDRVEEAQEYITELRSKLARQLYSSAQLYMRTDRYEAAIVYYDLVIEDYPESAWAERALVDKINAYVVYADNSIRDRQPERYEGAVEAYETYVQLFPNGENRSRAEEYVDEARAALADLENDNVVG